MMFMYQPKFLLYPIHDMVITKDLNVYLYALAVSRDAIINSHEMKAFMNGYKSRRLGVECPDNFDGFAAAMDHGQLLPRTVANEVVWSWLPSPSVPGVASDGWEFPHLPYFKEQLELAAHKHGLTSPRLRKTWQRDVQHDT